VDVQIIPDLLPTTHPIYGTAMTPEYVTIHETANTAPGANAAMHSRYLRSQDAIDRQVTWHFTVDDHEIRQHLPLDINAWHAGDGVSGTGNRKSIAIEICVNADGDFAAAQRQAAALVAHLIRTVPTLRPFPECVVQHNRWSGKDCPAKLRAAPGGWEQFLGLVQAALTPPRATVAVLDAAGSRLCDGWLEGDQTVVPLRDLAEAMGLVVDWEPGGPAVQLRWPGRKQ